ncbi:hypothetical protein MPSI1_003319 [Malassezia psittaci]|uniref:Multiple myeloma tumor-associated protein 2-like N-terminal domain-containing protein n=1 Tax=Malassezia psittaci TaxID=1821823 RepID=A0AAF0FD95_9BASI|nr:hypothetical protein MPSI1_003319 [Malassezia psittaci]
MYESSRRGGTRGGQADFSWDAVKEDKHRENYLGNSVAAPKGRWQQGRDILWYNRDTSAHEASANDRRKQELLQVKQAEQEAMNQLLGQNALGGAPSLGTALAQGSRERGSRTGANTAPLDVNKRSWGNTQNPDQRSSPDVVDKKRHHRSHQASESQQETHKERREGRHHHHHRHRSDDYKRRSDDYKHRSDDYKHRSADYRYRSDEQRYRSDDYRHRSDDHRSPYAKDRRDRYLDRPERSDHRSTPRTERGTDRLRRSPSPSQRRDI